MPPRVHTTFLAVLIALLPAGNRSSSAQGSTWEPIEEGLLVGEFASPQKSFLGDAKILIIRIDPEKYSLRLLSAKELRVPNMTADQWCRQYRLIGAINAGMFQGDGMTNVGYMKNGDFLNNPRIHARYKSMMAFGPIDKVHPRFRIFDLDRDDAKKIIRDYQVVVQNLRLIKRPGVNRWSPGPRKWSEAALGEDKDGHVLFIFSRSPYSMHDFIKILLRLPIGIVAAQHLEGGPEASLYFSYGGKTIKAFGSYETGFNENDGNQSYWPIPNVLGIVKRNGPLQ